MMHSYQQKSQYSLPYTVTNLPRRPPSKAQQPVLNSSNSLNNNSGPTITWSVNAHVKQKQNIIKRIFRKDPENAQNGNIKIILDNGFET